MSKLKTTLVLFSFLCSVTSFAGDTANTDAAIAATQKKLQFLNGLKAKNYDLPQSSPQNTDIVIYCGCEDWVGAEICVELGGYCGDGITTDMDNCYMPNAQ